MRCANRWIVALLALTVSLWLGSAPLVAQGTVGTKYWPLPKISFPIDVNEIQNLRPKPVSIRFYAAAPEGKFELIANKKPEDLERILDTNDPNAVPKRGFSFTAERNIIKEFAVQYEYADGSLSPETKHLQPQYRVNFDLSPPTIRASVSGKNSIRWVATDDNLLDNSIRLEGRMPGRVDEWQVLNTGPLRADDTFTWSNLPANETLEVRVYAKDRAGHSGRSAVQVLNGTEVARGGGGSDLKAPGVDRFGDPLRDRKRDTGFGNPDDFNNANTTKIEYVNTNKLMVSSKITHITRSGVKAAQLYVLHESSDWRPATKQDVNFTQETANPTVQMEYVAPKDGLYGFIIQPISGAGTKADDPRPSDTAQYLVQVDTTKPQMTVKSVRVTGAGLNGPLIEIEWESRDDNEWPEPITLEYSDDDKKTWKPIHGAKMIPNNGRYTWEITDKKLWKFFIRGTATDKAGNSTLHETPDPTLVDLDKPSGTVEKVNPNGQPSFPGKQAFREETTHGSEGIRVTAQPIKPTVQPASVSTEPDKLLIQPPVTSPMPMPTPMEPAAPSTAPPLPALPETPAPVPVNPTPAPAPAVPPVELPPMKPVEEAKPMPVPESPLPGGLDIPPLPPTEKK
jgi:hypothetical protein